MKKIIYTNEEITTEEGLIKFVTSHPINNIELNIGSNEEPRIVSPLILSVINGYTQAAKVILNKGADVNQICDGMSAFMYAAQNEKTPELMKLLVESGAKAIEGKFNPLIVYVHYIVLNIPQQNKDLVVKTLLNYAFEHKDENSIVAYAKDERVLEADKYEENLYKKAEKLGNNSLMEKLKEIGYDIKRIDNQEEASLLDIQNLQKEILPENFETTTLETEMEKTTLGSIEEDN